MAETYSAQTAACSLAASTVLKTAAALKASSTQPFRLVQLSVSCKATATGIITLQLLIGTISGGTAGAAPTIARVNGEAQNKSGQATVTGLYSAEPTWTKFGTNGTLIVYEAYLPLPTSPLFIQYPLGREGAYVKETNLLGVRMESTIATTVLLNISWEE